MRCSQSTAGAWLENFHRLADRPCSHHGCLDSLALAVALMGRTPGTVLAGERDAVFAAARAPTGSMTVQFTYLHGVTGRQSSS